MSFVNLVAHVVKVPDILGMAVLLRQCLQVVLAVESIKCNDTFQKLGFILCSRV